MSCTACGHRNPEHAKFCIECGSPLSHRCRKCGTDLPTGAKFCSECGTSVVEAPSAVESEPVDRSPRDYTPKHLVDKILSSRSALEGERKQVTVLFADIKGSMELAEQLDPEEWHAILDRFFAILTEGVHRFEGTVNQYTGDGIMALFGAPIAHEDHAQRACHAALQMRDKLLAGALEAKREHGISPAMRIGLHSGEVVVGKIGDDLRMDYTAQGQAVGLAQRMESLAEPNTCYLSEATAHLVEGYFSLEDLGTFQVKGVSDPVQVFELAGTGELQTRFEISQRRGLSRFVGRDSDIEALGAALSQAQAGNGQVVGVVGEAGGGKSRLCYEFLERCRSRGLSIMEGHAVAHGKNVPFLPMLEVFRAYYGITDQDDDRKAREKIAGRLLLLDEGFRDVLPVLFEFFGVSDPERPAPQLDPDRKQQLLFGVLRRVVQGGDPSLGRIVFLIEDLHWMDSGSGSFLEQWVDAIAGTDSFLLVTFRPEYSADWMSKSYYRQIPLAPLAPEAFHELLVDLLGRDESVEALPALIHERTGGNPFFAEEVVRSLIESEHLVGSQGAYRLTAPIESLEVPSSVQTVLAARIDRQGESEKEVLAAAAVIGRTFAEPILLAASEQTTQEIQRALRKLADAEFIYVHSLHPRPEFTFTHALTQEVALASQLRVRRQRTHGAVARALEHENEERLDEIAAVLAHHWEEGGDNSAAALWHRRAAEWAGINDVRAALHHWRRVRDLASEALEGSEQAKLAAAACSFILAFSWRLGASDEECQHVFEEGRALAERAEDPATLAALLANYSGIRGLNAGNTVDYVRYAQEAIEIADGCSEDAALRCGTRGYLIYAYFFAGHLGQILATCDEILEISDGDLHVGAELSGFSPALATRHTAAHARGQGGDPLPALRELPEARKLDLEHGYPEMATWALCDEGLLGFAIGRATGSDALAREALRLAETRGSFSELIVRATVLCPALALDGDWKELGEVAAETRRRMHETRTGLSFEPVAMDFLAAALLGLGEIENARRTAAEAVDLMVATGTRYWPHAHANLIRAQIELDEPPELVEASVGRYQSLLEETGKRLFQPELHELRALLAEREGDSGAWKAEIQRAYDLYVQIGAVAHAERLGARTDVASR